MSISSLNGTDISKLLKSKGPVVQAVLLRSGPEATIEQVEIDTTPQKQMVSKILGGPFTFLGQYEEEGIMLICLRDGDSKKLACNEHKLQPPFDASQVRGDVLLLRVAAEEDTEEGTDGAVVDTLASKSNDEFFLDYTKDEYNRFAARTDIKPPNPCLQQEEEAENMDSDDHEEEDDDGEGNFEGESDEDDDDAIGFIELLMGQVIERFQKEHGRMPDEVEMEALQSAIAQKVA